MGRGVVESFAEDLMIPSKLATTVFPPANDDSEIPEIREIEHAASKPVEGDDDDDNLKGLPSQIIPELTDFSKNLTEGEFEKQCSIEVIEVPFVVDCE